MRQGPRGYPFHRTGLGDSPGRWNAADDSPAKIRRHIRADTRDRPEPGGTYRAQPISQS
jgi:hypothetical protein